MISELRKAGPRLAGRDPPTSVVYVDLRSPGSARGRSGRFEEQRKRKHGSDGHAPAGPEVGVAKEQLVAETGLPLRDKPDLRCMRVTLLYPRRSVVC